MPHATSIRDALPTGYGSSHRRGGLARPSESHPFYTRLLSLQSFASCDQPIPAAVHFCPPTCDLPVLYPGRRQRRARARQRNRFTPVFLQKLRSSLGNHCYNLQATIYRCPTSHPSKSRFFGHIMVFTQVEEEAVIVI